jgi:N-acyl-D-amino-acid deacylase
MLDLLILNGTLTDGTGGSSFKADIAIDGDRIIDIGQLNHLVAEKTIDAKGKHILPGFIDLHSHNDFYLNRDRLSKIFEPYIRQGITTYVAGNCGDGVAPIPKKENRELFPAYLDSKGVSGVALDSFEWNSMDEFLSYAENKGPVANMIQLAPHNPIRLEVMGNASRPAQPAELEKMKRILFESMEAGCRGFSTGLMYYPGMFSHTLELIELNKICGHYNGRYATHIRSQCITFPEALNEAFEIAREGKTGLQISHFHAKPFLDKSAGLLQKSITLIEAIHKYLPLPPFPNSALKKGLRLLNEEIAAGLDVGIDMVPYMTANTSLTTVFPPWAMVGGMTKLIERLSDDVTWAEIKNAMKTVKPSLPLLGGKVWSNNISKAMGWGTIRILSVKSDKNRSLEGRYIVEIARQRGQDPWQTARELTIEEYGAVEIMAGFPLRPWVESNFSQLFSHPQLSVMCDSLIPEFGLPPQSLYGTFPRFLSRYWRDLKLMEFEEAVHKCTGSSASRFNIQHRGEIKKGYYADLVICDRKAIKDNSSPEKPDQFPSGIETVIINGKLVLEAGSYDYNANAGRVIR